MSVYNQYVLPQTPARIDGVTGIIDIRISRGLYAWNLIDTHPDQVLTLDKGVRAVKGYSPRKKAFADLDGDMTADTRTLVLNDALDYTGVSNGVNVVANLRSVNQSLFWQIFESDATIKLYQVWFAFMPSPNSGQYNAGTTYTSGKTVAFRGKTYKAIATTTGNSPVNTSTGLINTTWWVKNYSVYFAGDVDIANLAKIPVKVHKPRTAQQLEDNTLTLTLSPMVNRAKLGTIGMLVDGSTYAPLFTGSNAPTNVPFAQSDMVQFSAAHPGAGGGGTTSWTTTTRPFYLGICNRDQINGGDGTFAVDDFNIRVENQWYGGDTMGYMAPGLAAWDDSNWDNTWPHLMWGMKPATPLAKIANALNFEFDATTDFTSAFVFRGQTWDDTNKSYSIGSSPGDGHVVPLDKLAFCYNSVFGVSPVNSGPKLWNNPLAYAPDTSFADFLKSWAYQFGCYIWHTIDQVTGQVRMQLLSRRTSFGTIPAGWRMKKGFPKREASVIAKDYVAIKNKQADGELRCPAINAATAQGVTVELPLRVRPMGKIGIVAGGGVANDVFPPDKQIFNSKWGANHQLTGAAVVITSNTPPIGGDSWYVGSFLFEIKTSTNNDRYPPEWVHRSSFDAFGADNWDGFVAIAVCTENDSVSIPPGDSNTPHSQATVRIDTYSAPAQLLERELIDNRIVYTVEYEGVSDGSGDLLDIVPGMEDSWAPPGVTGGAVKTYRAVEVELDEILVTAKVKFIEKPPDYSVIPDLSTLFIGTGTSTSSGASSSPTQSDLGTATAGPHALVDNPNSPGFNNITPQTTTTIGLRHTRIGSQSVDFEQWNDESNANLAKITKDGDASFQKGTFNGQLDMTSHQIHNVLDPTSAQDGASKNYVDNAIATVGTVRSVGLSLPAELTVTGSPVTGTGTLAASWTSQTANKVFASPNGSTGTPTFRAIAAGDIASGTFILNAPGTTQTVTPTNGGISAVDLQANASQSVAIFNIRQSGGAVACSWSSLGSFTSEVPIFLHAMSGNFGTFTNGGVAKFTFSSGGQFTIGSSGSSKALSVNDGSSENFWVKANGDFSAVGNGAISGALTLTGNLICNGSLSSSQVSKTGAYTMATTDGMILADAHLAAFTLTLPTTANCAGKFFLIKRVNATATPNVTISPPSGTIDGAASKVLTTQYQTVWLTSDGTNWFIAN